MKYLGDPRSGSYQGLTASRNRYGQYMRTRAIPVNPNSAAQALARARLADLIQAYRTLTSAQRAGWADLGGQISRTDSLGQTYNLTGAQAYLSINSERLVAGDVAVSDAPGLAEPDPVAFGVLTLTAAAGSAIYSPTPLGAGERAFLWASPQVSAGRGFNADYRLITVTAAAAASPINFFAAYQARFGAPVVGNRIFFALARYAAGFLSERELLSQVVA